MRQGARELLEHLNLVAQGVRRREVFPGLPRVRVGRSFAMVHVDSME
ncbi:MAG TPA: hypothetical protein PKU91_04230 [Phycisphaerales bacterium]|nr:hypothetical protein [Phycisphaerales bacterium]